MKTNTRHSSAYSLDVLWDEDDLVSRLAQSLDFAEQAIRKLNEQGSTDDPSQQPSLNPEQLIADTAVLLLAASNVASYSAISPRVLRVASLLTPHAHSQRTLRGICLEPAAAFDYATAHICLKRLGFYDADFDAMLDLSVAAQASEGRERAPHRMIQQEWLRQGWLYPEGMPRLRTSAQITNSALTRTIDLLHGSREDVDSFTHALMYLRDFNLFPRTLPRQRECVLAEAEGILARCLDEQNYDLLGEVLLAWPLTGDTWSPAAAFAFRVLCNAEKQVGHLPATTRIDRSKRLDAATGRRYLLPATYQPIYVMGLLCAASLEPNRRPPAYIPVVSDRTGAFDAVAACFYPDPNHHKSHWQVELEKLAPMERDSLADFLLSIALHREVGRNNFAAIERLLAVGNNLGLTGNPVASQAGEMMVRVRQFSQYLEYSEALAPSSEVPVCA